MCTTDAGLSIANFAHLEIINDWNIINANSYLDSELHAVNFILLDKVKEEQPNLSRGEYYSNYSKTYYITVNRSKCPLTAAACWFFRVGKTPDRQQRAAITWHTAIFSRLALYNTHTIHSWAERIVPQSTNLHWGHLIILVHSESLVRHNIQ